MTYALITGASKGIGRAIAYDLARRGFPLLLVSRSQEALQRLASDLQAKYQVRVHHLAIDLTTPGASHTLLTWCLENDFKVSVLVNNAGYGLSGAFEKRSMAENMNMMQLNMNVPVELCHLFLPMLRQQPRAYILNIASTAAYQAVPYMSLYAASKAFLLFFSRGLRQELKKSTVSVTCISPGPADTDFVVRAEIGEKGLKTAQRVHMRPEEVAGIAVAAMLARRPEVVTGILNKITSFAAWLLPKGFIERTAMKIYE